MRRDRCMVYNGEVYCSADSRHYGQAHTALAWSPGLGKVRVRWCQVADRPRMTAQ